MTLGEKINFYRKRSKLSQEELAERVGVSRQAVSKWENGEATPEVEKLLALARAFGVTTDELLSPEEPVEASGDAENVPPNGEETPASSYRGTILDFGFLSRLIRRYGYLAGYYIALCGLGVLVAGIVFSAVVGQMQGAVSGFEGGSQTVVIDGYGAHVPSASSFSSSGFGDSAGAFSGVLSIFQFAGVLVILAGIAMVIGGLVLAHKLKKKGRED